MVFDEGTNKLNPKEALILFNWWQVDYKFLITFSIIEKIKNNPNFQYKLFSANTKQGGPCTFYLALSENAKIEVYRKRHWVRHEWGLQTLDTTILFNQDEKL